MIVFIELPQLKFSHGADENAGDLNRILFVSANETVGDGRIFRVQTETFGRFKDALEGGFTFEYDGGDFTVAHLAFGVEHGDIAIENASANHAVSAHAQCEQAFAAK